jgi:hypothetical protein
MMYCAPVGMRVPAARLYNSHDESGTAGPVLQVSVLQCCCRIRSRTRASSLREKTTTKASPDYNIIVLVVRFRSPLSL